MARRYLQTGTAPSPAAGGAAELASLGGPVNVGSAAAPTIGQLMTATGGSAANWANPPAAGFTDDPVVKTAGFTAAPNTRYGLASNFGNYAVFLPPAPAVGTIVAFQGVNFGGGYVTFNGNGFNIVPFGGLNYWGIAATRLYTILELDVAFRFENGYWQSVSASLSSLFSGGQTNLVPICDANSNVGFVQMSNGDISLGRVESSVIQALRPWNVAHNLFVAASTADTNTGSQTAWLGSLAALRNHAVYWQGTSDVIVRGLSASLASADFRHDKWILNNTGADGNQTYKNIIWKAEDTAATASNRIRHSSAKPSTDFSDYVQAPGEAVQLRYLEDHQRWFVISQPPSGRIDRKEVTTSVTPTIIHAYTTQTNSRVISYKVQVQARKTVGTTVGDSALFDVTALFERSSAGTVVSKDVAFVNGPYKDAGAAAWDVTFTISGSDIRMNVVGDAVDTIQWRVTGNITEHG